MAPAASASVIVAITVSPAPVTSAIWSEPKIGMCTVGLPGSNSAMPRLPRVISTRVHPRALQQRAAGALEHARAVVDRHAEHLLDFGFVRRAGGEPAIARQRVARVDQDRHAAFSMRSVAASVGDERRRHQPRAVVGDEHGIGALTARRGARARRPRDARRVTGSLV